MEPEFIANSADDDYRTVAEWEKSPHGPGFWHWNPKGYPETWIPVHESNPSKLTLHRFVKGKWQATSFAKCVAWPEAFPPPELAK